MKSIPVVVGMIILLLAVPVQAQKMTAAQKADIEKAVKAKVAELYSALDTLSPDAYMAMWSRNNMIGGLGPTGLDASEESGRKSIQGYRDNFKSRKTESMEVMAVQVVSPETAIAFSKCTFKAERNDGNSYDVNMGNTTIWIKESGGWKTAFMSAATARKQ